MRLKKEQVILKVISEISLGAWISVESEDDKERYKLVVKINSTDKFIFVDRLGLKKLEIKTDELLCRMNAGQIKVLSEGAEFDETLSRVVGRIRVGR